MYKNRNCFACTGISCYLLDDTYTIQIYSTVHECVRQIESTMHSTIQIDIFFDCSKVSSKEKPHHRQ